MWYYALMYGSIIILNFVVIFIISSLVYIIRTLHSKVAHSALLLVCFILLIAGIIVESSILSIAFPLTSSLGVYSIFVLKVRNLWIIEQILFISSGVFAFLYVLGKKLPIMTLFPLMTFYALIYPCIIMFFISAFLAGRIQAPKFRHICISIVGFELLLLIGFHIYIPWLVLLAIVVRDISIVLILRT